MSFHQKNQELKDDFVIRQIKMISELYEEEIYLDQIISNNNFIKKENFVLFVKEWLDSWKKIVNYEKLKDKCKKSEILEQIKDEVKDLFIKQKTKQKLEELGNMDCSKLKKANIKNKIYLNELSHFIPILDYQITSFSKYIQGRLTIRGEILNGKIYINDYIYGKDKEKRILLLSKENEEYKKYIITLEQKANINNMIKELKNLNIEDLLKRKEINEEIFYKNKIKNIENVKDIEEEEEIKRKVEEEKRIKEKEEERKRFEEEKRKKEEEEKRKKEEKRKRLEEEKRIKEEEERKRKEEEEKRIKEKEEERKRKEEKLNNNNNQNTFCNNYNILEENLYKKSISRFDQMKKVLKKSFNSSSLNNESIDSCIFCIEDFVQNPIINPLLECGKFIHGECFINYIDKELNNNHFPIRCPFCTENDRHEINYKIVMDCLLINNKDNLAIKLENISLNYLAQNNPDEISFCPTAGCDYMCFYDKNEYHLECPLCQKSYCLKCKTEWHENITCEENQLSIKGIKNQESEIIFEEYVKGCNFKKCPKCKRWVEKTEGCDHVICLCGTHFCYSCGEIRDSERPYDHRCPNSRNNGNFMMPNNIGMFNFNNPMFMNNMNMMNNFNNMNMRNNMNMMNNMNMRNNMNNFNNMNMNMMNNNIFNRYLNQDLAFFNNMNMNLMQNINNNLFNNTDRIFIAGDAVIIEINNNNTNINGNRFFRNNN